MKILILLGATGMTMGSLAAMNVSQPARQPTLTQPPASRIVSTTKDGKPILLARMVVTATPLDE